MVCKCFKMKYVICQILHIPNTIIKSRVKPNLHVSVHVCSSLQFKCSHTYTQTENRSSAAHATSSTDTNHIVVQHSIPYGLYRRHTASLLQVHLPLGVQRTPDGTPLDRSRSIVNHPNDDRSGNDHHSECYLTKEGH